MATTKNIKKGLCDEVFRGLSDMKEKVVAMRKDIARINGVEPAVSELFDRHLGELVDQVDWKLQILSHACPYDWTGSAEYEENTVSVGPTDKTLSDFSGGYLGG